ncbi:MAG: hypothetical protein ACYDDI_14400 [Candidatus Acidiferrales bacterium]
MTNDGNNSRRNESAARENVATGCAVLERGARENAATEDSASKRATSEIAASKSATRDSAGSRSTACKNAKSENTMVDHAVVKMLQLLDSGILEPGIFGEIVILHADGCARIEGKGICQCDPDLQLLPPRRKRAGRVHESARANVRAGNHAGGDSRRYRCVRGCVGAGLLVLIPVEGSRP